MKTMSKLLLMCSVFYLGSALHAENDPIGDQFFPPELVMRYQQTIDLTEEQTKAIKSEIQNAQAKFTDLEWELQKQMQSAEKEVSQQKIDEANALSILEEVLSLENDIKRTHLTLLIRIKNLLTPEQQMELEKVKQQIMEDH